MSALAFTTDRPVLFSGGQDIPDVEHASVPWYVGVDLSAVVSPGVAQPEGEFFPVPSSLTVILTSMNSFPAIAIASFRFDHAIPSRSCQGDP